LSRFTSLFRLRFVRNESAEPDSVASESEAESATGTASSATVPTESPEEIFVEIGQRLRKRRELLSLAVDEIERNIRVRGVFIRALEEGAFDRLPSAVQTRGMLANYAAFLDLDTDALLLRFADAIQAGHRMRYPEKPGGNKSPMRVSPSLPPLRSFIAGDLIFGISIAVLLITMAVWGVNRIFSTQSAEQVTLPTAPSISDVLATSQQPTVEQEVTLIPAADTPFLEVVINTPEATLETPAFNPAINVQVNVVVVERTFLRVLVDGEEVLNGRVTPGATYTYEASDLVEILTGNAAALRITYNGRDLGLMGNFGEVANRIYTAEGVVTPTPVVPPTATPTPTSTPTLSSTASATPKSPSPTPGGE
jgi:cytoskeletal protein RodZ